MTPKTLQALRAEAVRAGVVDSDVVSLINPDVVGQVESGQLSVGAAIDQFKQAKPGFFRPSLRELPKTEYSTRKSQALADLRQAGETAIPAPVKPIADMSRREYAEHRRSVGKALSRRGRR
jgi:hypothetical protein